MLRNFEGETLGGLRQVAEHGVSLAPPAPAVAAEVARVVAAVRETAILLLHPPVHF